MSEISCNQALDFPFFYCIKWSLRCCRSQMYWLEVFNHDGLFRRIENLGDEQLQPLTCLFLSTELAWQYGHMGDEHILGGCLLRSKEAHNEHILALELQDSGSSATLLN
ncbi:hypothetical protein VDR03_13875 [Xanthomonas campestris pv. campestris]|uniref:Uncharacterized protein n=2 Tax=Xanthomonas TaxID=338 RepID=B0RUV1_XANCB|nr:hypothetical protein [Xanthomonas campestris]APP77401.1 hypothetical protein BJD12_21700 [Xanthomonas vesicatoria ATCC 35937]KTF34607.1 hypothetical protein LMG920_05420 [Xanthomonas vesicatoria]MEA0924542.1 hypothetical protein [Xanthomonas campestris pv. campestris]MEB1432884.1 hypothetical protein [Xanthomonas campestris pv. campestris]MEB1521913.1 hypothetical protein [Xanthomonas campestris pv. campestris]